MVFLDHDQVDALANAAGDYALLVRVFAYTGLRWGEATALRGQRVDLVRRPLNVVEAASEHSGQVTIGTPKSHQRRYVPLPEFLAAELAHHLRGRRLGDLVFTAPGGGPLRNSNFRRDVFDPAARVAGLTGLRPHDLRHTAASLAIGAGANVKAVQQMLGHASAAMTLDVYAGLFLDDLSNVAQRLHEAVTARSVSTVCPPPQIEEPPDEQ
jgi:integrase